MLSNVFEETLLSSFHSITVHKAVKLEKSTIKAAEHVVHVTHAVYYKSSKAIQSYRKASKNVKYEA